MAEGALSPFLEERDRWALWLPVLSGLGIVIYFALDAEPEGWTGLAVSALFAGILVLARRPAGLRPIFVALLAMAIGFAVAQWRTARVTAPMLDREIGPVAVEGRVVGQDLLPSGGVRVLLDRPMIERLEPERTPAQVRVRLTPSSGPLPTGVRIRVLAVLNGPSPPAIPGAFDFRRHAFFQRIGGVGYAVSAPEMLLPEESDAFMLLLERWRQRIGQRVYEVLEGDVAAITAALLNGERGAISEETNAAMRDSGLAHLLSISGLHIGLVATLVFGGLRLLLAFSERIALYYPIKKWAAVVALAVTFFYTLMVGAPVPTQRSFLMTGIVLCAVLLDRTAISMRLVAWAAAAVLALAPESLLGPSFQMSFAAVIALIAFYEAGSRHMARWREGAGWGRLLLLYGTGVVLTTLVASLATTPFAVYHFQRVATYGIAANMVAVPLTSFWIMPLALIFYLLAPFGLDHVALVPMGWGVAAVIEVARVTAAWPGAAAAVPAMPDWAIAAIAFGGLWICLWRRRWRWLGLLGVLAGVVGAALPTTPDILVSGDGKLMAVRGTEGGLVMSSARTGRFAQGIWLARNGQTEPEFWPDVGSSADNAFSCDPLACLYRRDGRTVALVRHPAAFEEDCFGVDAVVAAIPSPRWCRPPVMIDRFDLWRSGAHALHIGPTGIRVESVAGEVGDRPWSLKR